jgi:hypothetical protein
MYKILASFVVSFVLNNDYLFTMKIEVSNGELIDKITILEIKLERIHDQEKVCNIRQEFEALNPLAQPLIGQIGTLYHDLARVNRKLWDIEDNIRDFERKADFGPGFIEAARMVYRLNDERSAIKKKINQATNSDLYEEKSYSAY